MAGPRLQCLFQIGFDYSQVQYSKL